MSQAIRRHPNVRQDLAEIFVYLGRDRVSSARRFLREVEASFQRLAVNPGMGPRYEPDDPLFEGVRFSTVSHFKKYLIFYRPIGGGIEILRVLHGARDIQGLLAEGFEPSDDDEDDVPTEKPDAP